MRFLREENVPAAFDGFGMARRGSVGRTGDL
jgi:hypothetical protein